MSIANPTLVQVGMAGRFDDRRHVVRCRVTLSVRDGGEVYYWNEYYLDDEQGGQLVLSYEEDDAGLVWRLFSEYAPREPFTAATAAARRVGDQVEAGERAIRVTFTGESRVEHIEGRAPEGVEMGDAARFFNAEAAGRMLVVSWTGEEVEHYYGGVVPAGVVARAFGMATVKAPRFKASGWAQGRSSSGRSAWEERGVVEWVKLAFATVVIVGCAAGMVGNFFSSDSDGGRGRRPEPAPLVAAGPAVLQPGDRARFTDEAGEAFRVVAWAQVEVGQVRRRFVRHEYALEGGRHDGGLLFQYRQDGVDRWIVLEPVARPAELRAVTLAALRKGGALTLGGREYRVSLVQHARVVQQAGGGAGERHWSAEPMYGLVAQREGEWLLVRWDGARLWCYRGWTASAPTVIASGKPW